MIRKLAILHIAIGALLAILPLGMLFGTLTQARAITGLDITFILVLGILPLSSLVAGIGLFLGHQWGRAAMTILSTVYLLLFPLGSLLGALGLWVLLFQKPGPSAAPGGLP